MINEYLRAGYPGLYVLTYEPLRAEKTLTPDNGWHSFAWDCQKGMGAALFRQPSLSFPLTDSYGFKKSGL